MTLLHLRILNPDGSWKTLRTLSLPVKEAAEGWSLQEVVQTILTDERTRRLASPSPTADTPKDKDSILAALATGGVRVPLPLEVWQMPADDELLRSVVQSLRDGLLLPVLNGEPWKEWTELRVLPKYSELWFAHSVWLQNLT